MTEQISIRIDEDMIKELDKMVDSEDKRFASRNHAIEFFIRKGMKADSE